jgi:hypothetical protein
MRVRVAPYNGQCQLWRLRSTYCLWCHTSSDKEVGGLTHQWGADQCLNEPHHTGDLCSTTVGTPEAIGKVRADLGSFLELVLVMHHGDLFLREVLVDTYYELVHRCLGLFKAAFSRKPPRRFGRKDDTNELQS